MTVMSKSFEIIKSDDVRQPEVLAGHLTIAKQQKTLNGDIVVKELNAKTKYLDPSKEGAQQRWLDSQKNAQKISDEIRAKNNPAYFVPKTFIAHGKVREQFASGKRWREVIKVLPKEDKEWAYKALAEFVNDMSELRPVKYQENIINNMPRFPIKNVDDLIKLLDTWDEKYVSNEDKKLIVDIYKYLCVIPENEVVVFGHNDLHGDNIIIDVEKRQIAIIDFEMAGYRLMADVLYRGILDSEDFWQYVNMLPRTTNPNLLWTFIPEHRALKKFLSWGYYEIIELGKGVESMSDIIKEQCKRIRTIFATAKLKSKVCTEKQKMPLVQMSHYEKE